MAIAVDVSKDPADVKSKFLGNFTKRQVICFGCAAVIGIPFYLFTHKELGTDVSALLMVGMMMPFFFLALYEKDGAPAEVYLKQMITMRFIRPGIRKYKTGNIYDDLRKRESIEKEVEALERKKRKWQDAHLEKDKNSHGKPNRAYIKGKPKAKKTQKRTHRGPSGKR